MDDLVGATPTPGYVVHALGSEDEQLHITSAEEPSSVAQASRVTGRLWRKSYTQAIGLKLVFKVKKDEHDVMV
jgi:hypothetical protein